MPPKPRKTRRQERRGTSHAASAEPGNGGKSEDVFHFVTVNPTSESQKSQNRTVIRSHASKYIWRQHRAIRGDSSSAAAQIVNSVEPSSVVTQLPSNPLERSLPPFSLSRIKAETEPSTNPSPVGVEGPLRDAIFEDRESVPVDALEAEEDDSPDSEHTQPPPPKTSTVTPSAAKNKVSAPTPRGATRNHVNRPFNKLINWLENPIQISPDLIEESAISKLMRYAAFDLWPGLVVGASGKKWDRGAAAENWMPSAMSNPALFTAFLYGAAGHMQTRKRLESAQVAPQTREERLEQIACEAETIKQLNKMMKDPSQVCSDEVILAVLCMAFNRIDYTTWSVQDPYPKAPLRNLQWLDVYGGLSLNDHHIKGLMALIQTKGGIDKLKLPGLAETLSTSGIMLATKYLAKPRLPFVPIYDETTTGHTPDWPSSETSIELGMLVEALRPQPIANAGLPEDLASTFYSMRDYNAVVNLHTQGVLYHLELSVIADRRNWIQYNLISIPPIYDIIDQIPDTPPTYEPCRLAAMIYSVLVIFPLPANNRPFDRLTGMIKSALVDSSMVTSWQHAMEMYIWVLMMGGIAAAGTSEISWFAAMFSDAIRSCNISTWEELKGVLRQIMWMDCVCDYGGRNLWMKATEVQIQ